MSHAKTSPKQGQEQDSQVSDQDFGTAWLTPFALFNPDTSLSKTSLGSRPRWVPAQGSLLLEQLSLTWPKQGTWDLGYAYELPTSEHLISESESSFLLPTPNAYESTPGANYMEEVRKNLDDPHKRLYLPGRKWHAQRTLSRMAPLLPTPSANDSTGPEGPTRTLRQEKGTGGPALRDLHYLLPTPTAGDAHSSGSRKLEGSNAHPGTSLTDAIVRERKHLLPTPTVNDARNTGGPSQERRRSLPLTEIASDVNGGSTPRRSFVGKENSVEVHPDQLTIEDA